MLVSKKQFNQLQQKIDEQQLQIQVLSTGIARSRRQIDLDQPITLRLRPLSAYTSTAIRQGLSELFSKKYFDICLFDKLVKLACVYPPQDLIRHINALHCVDWVDMDPDYRDQIQQHILACFVPVDAGESDQPADCTL